MIQTINIKWQRLVDDDGQTCPRCSVTGEAVQEAVRACVLTLAPDGTGLILGPSHRMQSDIPPENVAAMLKAFPSLRLPDWKTGRTSRLDNLSHLR